MIAWVHYFHSTVPYHIVCECPLSFEVSFPLSQLSSAVATHCVHAALPGHCWDVYDPLLSAAWQAPTGPCESTHISLTTLMIANTTCM